MYSEMDITGLLSYYTKAQFMVIELKIFMIDVTIKGQQSRLY